MKDEAGLWMILKNSFNWKYDLYILKEKITKFLFNMTKWFQSLRI